MSDFSSRHFHHVTKRHKQTPEKWPEIWNKTLYKEYPRLKTIALSDALHEVDLFSLIKTRVSRRTYSELTVTLLDIGTLLKYSCGNTHIMYNDDGSECGRSHRAVPSAGARFPIEAYVVIIRPSDDLSAGIYHYRVREHKLEVLCVRTFDAKDVQQLLTYEWAWEASAVVFLTAVFNRMQDKYGERGYRYILLEAGHIAQNICLISTALGIHTCPLAGTHDEAVESLLKIDGISESLVYAVALGR